MYFSLQCIELLCKYVQKILSALSKLINWNLLEVLWVLICLLVLFGHKGMHLHFTVTVLLFLCQRRCSVIQLLLCEESKITS